MKLYTIVVAAAVASSAPVSARLGDPMVHAPARTLTCVLGRSTNLDPGKQQTYADIKSEGHHRFSLFLPAHVYDSRVTPDPTDAPDPVDKRTAIVSDPDGLTTGVARKFDRVVDLWPRRVEMMTMIDPPLSQLIIVSDIDVATGRAHLFMTKARDAATLDLDHVYQGSCAVKVDLQHAAGA